MDYLNDVEKAKLIAINKDQVAIEALKKVFLEEIYYKGVLKVDRSSVPLKNYLLVMAAKAKSAGTSNEKLGADLLATWEGINAVESGFQALSKFKEQGVPTPFDKEEQNPGV